ncbi:unnamed protein product [Paramecium octaurelia]|uniref:Uncharacterized protein n=1 Tax=Paramecium octaurelia TaxID=43137 RepID=A0A8S1WVX2_PAROT|nr:unnamed protein product [Paramecium octaurelia]CAD8192815.1 unnamed protein product [Paramecium octaurelia]
MSNQDSQDKSYEFKIDSDLPKFQNLPMNEYYQMEFKQALQSGLREIAIQKPQNAVRFLGEYLLSYKSKK